VKISKTAEGTREDHNEYVVYVYASSRYDELAFRYIQAMKTQIISKGFDDT
jgi:hypothetical protein